MQIPEILTPPKTIAVIGLSDKPERASNQVAKYLQGHGFTIIPVNPNIAEFMGAKAYASLSEIPDDIQIDVVDIFRKPEEVPAVVMEVIKSGRKPVIWMQEGVVSQEAKKEAEHRGMTVVMDRCMMKEHAMLQI